MKYAVFLVVIILLLSGCTEPAVEHDALAGDTEVKKAPSLVQKSLLEEEITLEAVFVDVDIEMVLEYDYIDANDLFDAFFLVVGRELEKLPDARDVYVLFREDGDNLFSISAPATAVKQKLDGGSLSNFLSNAEIKLLIPPAEALEAQLFGFGLEDARVSSSGGIVEVSYILPPSFADDAAHRNLMTSVFLESVYAFTSSTKVILNEQIEMVTADWDIVTKDFAEIETTTQNIKQFVSGDITYFEFLESVTVTPIYSYTSQEPDVCGDGVCSEKENQTKNCGTPCLNQPCITPCWKYCEDDCGIHESRIKEGCSSDSDCEDMQVCSEGECFDVECKEDADCDDEDDCTRDECVFADNKNAVCSTHEVVECNDNDGCCPDGCEYETDDDCEAPEEEISTESDGWITGTATTDLSGDHEFFDFSAGIITDDFDNGDIFFNSFGDLMGQCNMDNCVEIKEETSLSFDDMVDSPTSGYEGYYEMVSEGQEFWIKTLEGKSGKVEITELVIVDDFVTSVSFKWGYQE